METCITQDILFPYKYVSGNVELYGKGQRHNYSSVQTLAWILGDMELQINC